MDTPRILIVEDSHVTQKTLEGLFTQLCCDVKIFTTAEEALEGLRIDAAYDVIILDFKLPGKSGPQLFKEIVTNPRCRAIPVIPFTSQWTEKWMNPTMVGQWMASAKYLKEIYDMDIEPIISKGAQGEDVANVPEELVLRVAHIIERRGKSLPGPYKEITEYLLKTAEHRVTENS
jgi:CheY-like chemotaxis protein